MLGGAKPKGISLHVGLHRVDPIHYAGWKGERIWRLYMAGAAPGFRSGRLNVYQTLLAKPLHGQSGLPLTATTGIASRPKPIRVPG